MENQKNTNTIRKKAKRDKPITIVVTEEEREKLRALAEENNRSLSSFIYYYLKETKLI